MRNFINLVGLLAIIVAAGVFIAKNMQTVEVDFYYAKGAFPVCAVILVPLVIGVLGGGLLDVIKIFMLKNENKKLKRELDQTSAPQELQE